MPKLLTSRVKRRTRIEETYIQTNIDKIMHTYKHNVENRPNLNICCYFWQWLMIFTIMIITTTKVYSRYARCVVEWIDRSTHTCHTGMQDLSPKCVKFTQKWDKYVLKSDLKKSPICPIRAQCEPLWSQTWLSRNL